MKDPGAEDTGTSLNLRVLMACDTFFPDVNGAARFTERLSAGLTSRGVQVTVAAPAPSRLETGERLENIEGTDLTVHRLKSHKLWVHEWLRFVYPWTAKRALKKVFDDVNPDVVHIQSHFLIGRAAVKIAKSRGKKIVATNHVMPENVLDLKKMPEFFKSWAVKALWRDARNVIKNASSVTTPTKKAAVFLEENTGIRGVIPISCGIDASGYTQTVKRPDVDTIVFLGRLNQEKQVDVVLRALSRFKETERPSFEVIGSGDQMDALKNLATELGVAKSVHWHGKTSESKLREVLGRGTVFVMPSIAELQSIATLEAMASGMPVVAADAMALPHLVDNGYNGYLFRPGDDADLADLLSRVLRSSDEEYFAMRRASLKMVEAHDINRTISAFVSLYRD